MKYIQLPFIIAIFFLLTSCNREVSIPEKATAIQNFDANKYMGTWYEIARLDNRFEKNLEQVSATYSLNDNNTVKVINKGYNTKKEKWSTANGKAKFIGDETVGRLKVSFFGPFYGGYNIIALDKDYQNVMVAGNDLTYLWLLSRQKEMPETIKQEYLKQAKEIGFNIDALVWVNQTNN